MGDFIRIRYGAWEDNMYRTKGHLVIGKLIGGMFFEDRTLCGATRDNHFEFANMRFHSMLISSHLTEEGMGCAECAKWLEWGKLRDEVEWIEMIRAQRRGEI